MTDSRNDIGAPFPARADMELEPRRLVTYNLPLTLGDPTRAVLIVPEDLTMDEADRIRAFVTALADRLRA